ncbi:MAG: hypothetical protein R3C25_13975 [Hyphomonadaceae bacterium]
MSGREVTVWCGLMGVTAVGAAAMAATTSAPFSLPLIAASTAAAVAVNITAAKIDRVWSAFKEQRLARLEAGKTLDQNHDEMRAIREAQLEALRELLERYNRYAAGFSDEYRKDEEFAQRALAWVRGEIGCFANVELTHDASIEASVRQSVLSAFASRVKAERSTGATETAAVLRGAAEQAVLSELAAATEGDPPEDFAQWFHDAQTGWFCGFTVQMSAKIKQRPALAAIWIAMRVAWIGEQTESIQSELAILHDYAAGLSDALHGRAPVSLYLPQVERPRPQDRLSFKNTDIPFHGRAAELAVLQAFLDDPSPFTWHIVTGPGGAGKSRLALELCLRNNGPWRTGFARDDARLENRGDLEWAPAKPHLIVIDYVISNAGLVTTLLSGLATRTTPLAHKVRVLLLDRHEDEFLTERTWGEASARQEIRAARWEGPMLELDAPSDDDIWRTALPFLADAPVSREEFLRWHGEIDPCRRMLTALLLAESCARGDSSTGSLIELLDEHLVHERKVWANTGVREDVEEPLLALATMTDGYVPKRDGSRLPSEYAATLDRDPEDGSIARLARLAPPFEQSPAVIGRYLPDLVGEYFALTLLNRQCTPDPVTGAPRRSWLIDVAWRSGNGDAMFEFVRRAGWDFPFLSQAIDLDRPVSGVAASFHWRCFLEIWRAETEPEIVDGLGRVATLMKANSSDPAALEAWGGALINCSSRGIHGPVLYEHLQTLTEAVQSARASGATGDFLDIWANTVTRLMSPANFADAGSAQALLDSVEAIAFDADVPPRMRERWARGVQAFIGQWVETDPAAAYAWLHKVESRSAGSGSFDVFAEAYVRSVAAMVAGLAGARPDEARTLLNILSVRAHKSDVHQLELEQWAHAAAHCIYHEAEHEPERARALLDELGAMAHSEAASPEVAEMWRLSVANLTNRAAEVDRAEALALFEMTFAGEVNPAALDRWCAGVARAVPMLASTDRPTARRLLNHLALLLEDPKYREFDSVRTGWVFSASHFISAVVEEEGVNVRELLATLEQRALAPDAPDIFRMAWASAAAKYVFYVAHQAPDDADVLVQKLKVCAFADDAHPDLAGHLAFSIPAVVRGYAQSGQLEHVWRVYRETPWYDLPFDEFAFGWVLSLRFAIEAKLKLDGLPSPELLRDLQYVSDRGSNLSRVSDIIEWCRELLAGSVNNRPT